LARKQEVTPATKGPRHRPGIKGITFEQDGIPLNHGRGCQGLYLEGSIILLKLLKKKNIFFVDPLNIEP